MGVGRAVLYVSGVGVVLLGFLLYTPLHPDVDEPFKMRCMAAGAKFGKFIGDVGALFGYDKFISQRDMANSLADIMQEPPSEGIVVRTTEMGGVPVRIFEPEAQSKKPRPALIYIHGGWFFMGSSLIYSGTTDLLALYLDAVVISVDYRLHPEHGFPAGFEDCYTVAMHVFNHARHLHINPLDVGVAGDSAGGTLAAAVAQKLRDDGGKPQFRYQVLIYPVTQAITLDLPSYHTNEWYNPAMLSRSYFAEVFLSYIGADRSLVDVVLAGNHTPPDVWHKYSHLVSLDHFVMDVSPGQFTEHYGIRTDRTLSQGHAGISHEALRKLLHPYAFPLMADSLRDLPAALIVTLESDTLRDDGMLYAQRLRADGVRVLHHHKRDAVHGYIGFSKGPLWVEAARTTLRDIASFVQKIS